MTIQPSRRTVVAGAAWTLPAVTIAAAAPAYAASSNTPIIYAPEPLQFTRYTDVATWANTILGVRRTNSVSRVNFTVPQIPIEVLAGTTVPALSISYTSTLGPAATAAAYSAGGRTIASGSMTSVVNTGVANVTANMTLSPGNVAIPNASGSQLVTNFVGTIPSWTAPTTPGVYSISFVNPAPPAPVNTWDGNTPAATGSQVVNAILGQTVNNRVHSYTPTTITTPNEFGASGAQSLVIATYTVV
jgi:hypothetical protein